MTQNFHPEYLKIQGVYLYPEKQASKKNDEKKNADVIEVD